MRPEKSNADQFSFKHCSRIPNPRLHTFGKQTTKRARLKTNKKIINRHSTLNETVHPKVPHRRYPTKRYTTKWYTLRRIHPAFLMEKPTKMCGPLESHRPQPTKVSARPIRYGAFEFVWVIHACVSVAFTNLHTQTHMPIPSLPLYSISGTTSGGIFDMCYPSNNQKKLMSFNV